MPRLIFSLISVLFAGALSGQDFPLGIIERNAEVSLELPFTTNESEILFGPITTDCECLASLGAPAKAVLGQPVRFPFKYRSPRTGRVRVNVWVQGATPDVVAARYTVRGFVYDKSWIVTAREVKNDSTAVVVDTRWKQQFEQVRIPHSLNLPAFALKTRSDLRDRRVVLVDGGFAPEELLELVQNLRAEGFRDVVYLAGGLPAWLRAGGAHEGTAVEPAVAAATISSIDLARAQVNSVWRLVDLPGNTRSAGWPAPGELQRLRKLLSETAAEGTQPAPVLAIAEEDSSYTTVEHTVTRSPTRSLYYLSGGAPALASFQRTQEALVNRPAETFQTRIAAPRPLMGSGCGTCPKR